jgi:acyl-CoA thioester hydrolase
VEPSAGAFEGLEHVLALRVYYEDTDLTGLVDHANYARYFERGRSDFLRLTGVDHASLLAHDDPTAFAVTRLTIAYRQAARIDDALEVRTRIAARRGARLIFAQRILRGETLLAEGEVEAVCIGREGRVRRPPPALVAAMSPWVSSDAP